VPAGSITMLLGFDRPAAETFVNLITGTSLPEKGSVEIFGQPTSALTNSDEWLAFVERFGIVSDRVVLLDSMSVAQNLAISFDLNLEPVPPEVMSRVADLAAEVGIGAESLETRVADGSPLLRSKIYLARALALDPEILVLEHPTANLSPDEAQAFAPIVNRLSQSRNVTTIGLLMDEKFARSTGGRLFHWEPATGAVNPPSRFARLRGALRRDNGV
jgi:ABC-type transporter Mla maintaining outer membrane lipid asymmetry ATPase subunit MlaF